MKFCIHCGQQIGDEARFCSHCGHKQVSSSESLPVNKAVQHITPQWVSCANFTLWSVLLLSIVGFLGPLFMGILIYKYMYVSFHGANYYEMMVINNDLKQAQVIFPILQILMIIAYCLYIGALKLFAKCQSDQHAKGSINQVIVSVCVQAICFLVMVYMQDFTKDFIWWIWLILYIVAVVSYFIQLNGFSHLMKSPSYSERAQLGAKSLRLAALCNIRLLLLPFATLAVLFIIFLAFSNHSIIAKFDLNFIQSLGLYLAEIFFSASERATTAATLSKITLIVSAVFALLWILCILICPASGWYQIKTADRPSADSESSRDAAKETPSDGEAPAAEESSTEETPVAEETPHVEETSVREESQAVDECKDEVALCTEVPSINNIEDEAPKSKKKLFIILGGILSVALIAGGVYFFLNKDKDNDKVEDESYVIEYSISHNTEEGSWVYYADTADGLVSTGIEGCGLYTEILDQHDFDGDGHLDALVRENGGGNAHAPYPSVIYYDEDANCFKQTEEFEAPNVTLKEVDGEWTFIEYTGIRETHFAFKEGKVTVVNEDVQSVGQADRRYMLSNFYRDNEDGEKIIRYDLDDDGSDEWLTVFRGFSHAENYGQTMNLEEIKWSNGKRLRRFVNINNNWTENYSIWGAEIVFLQSKTNGMHDILTDNTHYHRWNGSTYKEWEWNGTELVCNDTSQGRYETSWVGNYSFTGVINGQWHFTMNLYIDQDNEVYGGYKVQESDNGYVELRGTVDSDGKIRIDEFFEDGSPTGYYFQGTFSTTGLSGKYLSTERQIDMSFYAN